MRKAIGQIGIGAWGKNLFRNIQSIEGFDLKVVCDQDQERLEKIRGKDPELKFTTNYKDVIESDVEAVFISSPTDTHYKFAKEALQTDKDIFVEKPFTLDVENADELIEIADKKDRIIMVGHIMVYHPAVSKLKEYKENQKLGEIYYLNANRVNLGKVRQNENAMWSFAPHDISVFLYLLEQEPIKVSATGSSFIQDGIEDVSFVSLFFEDDIICHVHTSWLDPHKMRKITLVGSEKMAVFEDTKATEKVKVYDKGVDVQEEYETYGEYLSLRSGDILVPQIENDEPLMLECEHFLEAIRERKSPLSDGREGRKVVGILNAAQKSLENSGEPVEVDKY